MVVEDGTGLDFADSYVSIGFADDYFSARGYSAWMPLAVDAKEAALIKATDYIDASMPWKGTKATAEQALCWPRLNVVDSDGYTVEGIPLRLRQAVCDAAFASIGGEELFRDADASGAITLEQIGDIKYQYDTSKSDNDKTLYEAVNKKLRGLYNNTEEYNSSYGLVSAAIERV